MQLEDARFLTSKTLKRSKKIVVRCGEQENSEKSTHITTLKTATLNNLELSDFWCFSASERPNVSGWDGTFHELKRGNRKNEVQRPSYWRRELVRSNNDVLIKTQDSLISSFLIYFNFKFLHKHPNNSGYKMWWVMRSLKTLQILFLSTFDMVHFKPESLNCWSLKPHSRGAISIHPMQTELRRSCVEKMSARQPAASVHA